MVPSSCRLQLVFPAIFILASTNYPINWTWGGLNDSAGIGAGFGLQAAIPSLLFTNNIIYFNYDGGVGIGTTNPGTYKLNINGTGFLNDTAWHYSSDRRLKDNISYFDNNNLDALSLIGQLRPASFDYIHGATGTVGFIAQDVQNVLPGLIATGTDGMLSMQTTNLIPYLVRGMQEQEQKIDALGSGSSGTTAGTETVNNLEMKDSATGETYCIWIANGEWQKAVGTAPRFPAMARRQLIILLPAKQQMIPPRTPLLPARQPIIPARPHHPRQAIPRHFQLRRLVMQAQPIFNNLNIYLVFIKFDKLVD